ncbi:MAG TPA: S9 family peptidase [Chthoniobacterales bacterium]|jgi:dipeptidyl aminopeptidase/acylaminoacyl peptidase|nr:S9 family peptidase [Chthoniobacterales bacterium]
MRVKLLVPIFFLVAAAFAQSPQKHPFTFEDMMKLKRLDEPVPSPDGKWVVFSATEVDLEANTKISHLWIVPASGPAAAGKRLNETPNHEERPRFSPDGKRLIWTSKATDPTQIWMCDFDSGSGALVGKPHQVTDISTGADGAIWSPDGKNIVFGSAVYPDCKDDACNKQRDDELKKSKVKAKIFTKLFYRHWNAFTEFKRSHLFVIGADSVVAAAVSAAEPNKQAPAAAGASTTPRDLTPGDHDVPPFHLGGQDMYAISPDGQELAYTSNIDEIEATSTNNEIFVVPIVAAAVSGGSPPTAKKISTSPGADTTPLYSPDGKYLAWRSQARAGFEADKWRLFVQDRQSGKTRDLTEKFDRSVGSFTWADIALRNVQGKIDVIYFTAEDRGISPIYALSTDGRGPTAYVPKPGGRPEANPPLHADDLSFVNSTIFFTNMSITSPAEIRSTWIPDQLGSFIQEEPKQVTHMNDALLSQIEMQPLESFTFKGANDEEVQGFMVKPPGFDPNKKYPLKFLIHGGPQGAWGNEWTYRWNAELFAANGYVVVMINFHGSTGYGQKFTDSISGDWGGKPYIDLMKGLDYVEKTYPFIDKNRQAALGASYGGYMANWLLGHTDRFKCIVSHDGMFNSESAYGTTEELWFNEWEFKGPPWKNRELYRKWSPHLFADKFKTPTLVIHGQNDYRLDVSEGFQLFTTLQRLKIPSKMLYFPDEGHWVLKPQNSRLWYKTVNDWVDQWCGPSRTGP